MYIHLGNLSVEQIEKRTGLTFSDEDKKYMNEHRQEDVSVSIEAEKWHCFDIPFMLMTRNKTTAKKYLEMLSAYDWSKSKEALQIGYESEE